MCARKCIPRGCRTKYISGLTLESGELLKHYQELYDADPFSEDTIDAGTNLNDHIKETRKQKWEETITLRTTARKGGRPSQRSMETMVSIEQIILSGILPVFGNRIDGYRNSKRMAINGMVTRLCKEEDVGYVDLWDSVVGKEGMYARDGLHLSGKGAAVFAEGLSGAVASGLGKVRYLN